MKKSVALFVFALITLISFAQITDIPDYRNKREGFKKLTDKDIRSDLGAFALGALDEGLNKEQLEQLPVTAYGDNYIRFANEDIEINIKADTFDVAKHKLNYYDKFLVRLDNKPYWGIYGKIPKMSITSVTAVVDGDSVSIPNAAITDLHDPRFCKANTGSNTAQCNTAVYFSKDKHRIYIYMLNSDGRNGYEVTWILQDKQYLRRVVDYGF